MIENTEHDAEQAARLARLEREVAELRDARGEVGLRIRAVYVAALNAARFERVRRGRARKKMEA